jgi:hypothetical protein
MRSTLRVASVALAASLAIAACGSDDSGSGAGTPTETIESADTTPDATTGDTTPDTTTVDTEPESSEPEDARQDVDADTASAEAALLTVTDLPEGWTETPREADAAAIDARLAECVGIDGDSITAADATAQGALFTAPNGALLLTQDIGVLATERDARTVVAFTAEPTVPSCFAEAYAELGADVFAGTLAEGAELGAPTATRLQVGSAGDATQAVRVVVPVTGDPAVTEITIDHVVVRGGRALAALTFENRAEATPVETIDAVTAAVATRLGV